jgi:hypothetical protein
MGTEVYNFHVFILKEEDKLATSKGTDTKVKTLGLIGFWAFIIGLVIALVFGIIAAITSGMDTSWIIIILIILGIIIGFLNITAKEVPTLLLATIALIVVGNVFAPLPGIGKLIGSVLGYVAVLVSPAAIIAAIKALWVIGKPGD